MNSVHTERKKTKIDWRHYQRLSARATEKYIEDLVKNEEGKLWSTYAASYDRLIAHFPIYQELRGLVLESMDTINTGREDSFLIDMGAGAGHMLGPLSAYGHVQGVEKNPEMIAKAKERTKRNSRVGIIQGDMRTYRPPHMADGVVFANSLYVLDQDVADRVLENAVDYLRQGGVISVAGPRPGVDLDDIWEKEKPALQRKGIDRRFPKEFVEFEICNRVIARMGMRNKMTNGELEDKLKHYGADIIESQRVYHGHEHFVAGQKPVRKEDLPGHEAVKRNVVHDLDAEVTAPVAREEYILDVARAPKDFEESFSLRYRNFWEDDILRFRNREGLLMDRYDKDAVQVVAKKKDDGKVIGTVRLLPRKPGAALNFGDRYEGAIKEDEPTAETSRLAVDRSSNGKDIGADMLRYANAIAHRMGIPTVVSFGRADLEGYLSRCGYRRRSGEQRFTRGLFTTTHAGVVYTCDTSRHGL
ncbi:MAG: GNAT family N-acetyltransferase [Candidatus Woesearchaeota archaeon]